MVADSAEQLAACLDAIHADSRGYHLAPRDVAVEVRIKMALQDAAMHALGLSEICNDSETLARCRSDIAALRRAISGEHFEDEHDGPLPETAQQFQRIADAFLKAKRSFLQLKHRQFPVV